MRNRTVSHAGDSDICSHYQVQVYLMYIDLLFDVHSGEKTDRTAFIKYDSHLWHVTQIDKNTAISRGGSRISRRRGRQPSRRGAPAYKFSRFSEKLHEIKKILVRRGVGGCTGGAPLDPPLISTFQFTILHIFTTSQRVSVAPPGKRIGGERWNMCGCLWWPSFYNLFLQAEGHAPPLPLAFLGPLLSFKVLFLLEGVTIQKLWFQSRPRVEYLQHLVDTFFKMKRFSSN